jgi:uncharacterized damage-inducible protein DinB
MIGRRSAPAQAVAAHLVELAAVLDRLDDETYRAARTDRVSGSIGAHVRHLLDHVAALVEPALPQVVDYDSRRRGTLVEHHRFTAIAELRRLALRLQRLPARAESTVIELSAVIEADGDRVRTGTTVGRELVFVLSHTVHHQAIIALLLASRGQALPDRFGLAPSTPSFAPCAQSA